MASLGLGGCTASGQIEGGQYIVETIEAGPAVDLDLTLPADCNDGGTNAGSRWQDLYACYFGTSGATSCAGTGTDCHASSASFGFIGTIYLDSAGTNGFQCPSDSTTCFTAMTSLLIGSSGSSDPEGTVLLRALRPAVDQMSCPAGTCMPAAPFTNLAFGPDDLARITAWIAGGAKNN